MIDSSKLLEQLKNPYDTPPDFKELANVVPEFESHLVESSKGKWTIDWKNDESVRCLTQALLKRDFDLALELPSDRLCPTVPSRLEYCLWVLKLSLLTIRPSLHEMNRRFIGIDIGTGASCIYPLLLNRLLERLQPTLSGSLSSSVSTADESTGQSHFDCKILATEINDESIAIARLNISKNLKDEEGKIEVCPAREEDHDLIGTSLLNTKLQPGKLVDFVMCNPPFYASSEEIQLSALQKELEPFAVCTAANNELITTGGEVEFVKRMIEESIRIGPTRVRWFTSLIGKFSSISPLVAQLRQYQISNYQVHLLGNSGQTRRWILSWSLQGERIPPILLFQPDPSDPSSSTLRKYLPEPFGIKLYSHHLSPDSPLLLSVDPESVSSSLRSIVEETFTGLGDAVTVMVRGPSSSETEMEVKTVRVSVVAKENSWSRSARRNATTSSSSTNPPPSNPQSPDPPTSPSPNQSLELPTAPNDNLLEVDFSISLSPSPTQLNLTSSTSPVEHSSGGEIILRVEWIRGLDSRSSGIAFESLWGVLKRKFREVVEARDGIARVGGEEAEGTASRGGRKKRRKAER
ncbi:uncharacterized protein JCM6883_002698 [Sporobolomyces salmoneus]|uniref:uncharacterized protein n=1 Tax=Sporobolomyces salmoneus TaxID=183962 RepID=UPI00316FE11C